MSDEQIDDLKVFLATTVRGEVNNAVENKTREVVRDEVNKAVETKTREVVRDEVNKAVETKTREVVRDEVNKAVETKTREVVREEIDIAISEVKEQIRALSSSVAEALDASNDANGRRIEDHEQRIGRLEQKIA